MKYEVGKFQLAPLPHFRSKFCSLRLVPFVKQKYLDFISGPYWKVQAIKLYSTQNSPRCFRKACRILRNKMKTFPDFWKVNKYNRID